MEDSVLQTRLLVSQGNSFGRETSLAGKLVSQRNSFLVNSIKTFIFIPLVKHITCNTKVGEIISFCDFFQKSYGGSTS